MNVPRKPSPNSGQYNQGEVDQYIVDLCEVHRLAMIDIARDRDHARTELNAARGELHDLTHLYEDSDRIIDSYRVIVADLSGRPPR